MKKVLYCGMLVALTFAGCTRKASHVTYEGSPIAVDTFIGRITAMDCDAVTGNLALGFSDSLVIIWDPPDRKPVVQIKRHGHIINDVAFSKDGNLLAVASADEIVTINNPHNGSLVDSIVHLNGPATCVDFSYDGRFLAMGFADKVLELWETTMHETIGELRDTFGVITKVKFRPGTYDFYLASRDSFFYIANALDTVSSFKFKENYGYINALAVSNDGRYFATGGTNQLVKVWESDTITSIGWFQKDLGKINSLSFSPDGSIIVACDQDGQVVFLTLVSPSTDSVYLRNIETGLKMAIVEMGRFKGHQGAIRACEFSPDGKKLYTGGDDRVLKTWDVKAILAELKTKASNKP